MSFVAPLTEATKSNPPPLWLTRVTLNRRVNQSTPEYLLTRPGFIEVDAAARINPDTLGSPHFIFHPHPSSFILALVPAARIQRFVRAPDVNNANSAQRQHGCSCQRVA